ncbi:hypothetical protein ACQE3D_10870 [Methylomonas sp. MS20]|uniref:hypothetical protein n=1 Tax=unclassified Methylomonas TaxID=2608980 RepID=UPI0028A474BE|nr:hypothetical protein [Methylomonas sp. MV1]MDT4328500.1 hypothetical protein [Methylomonas sp. MV1]
MMTDSAEKLNNLLDSIARLCAYWNRWREKGHTPVGVGAALATLAQEVAMHVARSDLEQLDPRELEHLNHVAVLRIAADYLDWLHVNKRGSTFSTFVDEFGYDSMLATAVFKAVGTLIRETEFMAFSEGAIGDVDYPRPPYVAEAEDD